MKKILTLILGGGRGTRLLPLTKYRSKPAVPVAGKYRLIDIPLSNCINSGLNRMYVLTQFNSVSLHRHIRQTYRFDAFSGGFVEILAAQQTMEHGDWYQGTADAVRKNLRYIQQPGVDYVLVLSGDQLYRMDYMQMLRTHREAGAHVTIAAIPVTREEASRSGIMRINDKGRVVGFLEKPKTAEEQNLVRTDPAWLDARGVSARGRDCLASMGIYLFNQETLLDVLEKTEYQDFGKEIFPASIRARRVHAHLFDGYWEDIGTIRSFFEANLALATPNPPFEFHAPESPIYTRPRFLPPSRIDGATIHNSTIADGCFIEQGATIENSVVGLRCRIGRGAVIKNSILMGSDWYENEKDAAADRTAGRPAVAIGEGSYIEGAIVDKNCRIGKNVRIVNTSDETEWEGGNVEIRDGVLVVGREATLPDGWTLKTS